MKTISLFVNTNVGYDISKFLSNDPSLIIEYLFLSGQYEDIDNKILKVFKNSKTKIIKNSNPKEVSKFLSNSNLDFHITVYWPYLLDKETIQKAKSSVNFHPAFLPINRGWYPHVHSIIDGSKSGVTLHEINEFADKGNIWMQKEINIPLDFDAKMSYELLQNEIILLFKNNWNDIKNNSIKPFKQNETLANYHKKNEINDMDLFDIKNDNNLKVINFLRARSFGNKGFSYFINEKGEKVYMNIKFSKTNNFKK
ncbi:MAG: hypothetical protein HOH98_05050 [Flavobacteriaceae bacterium]|jgi:methionyl-tRNA formyltransferase|nr:hypothetical protein [Flavobacteriaceae bacterium]